MNRASIPKPFPDQTLRVALALYLLCLLVAPFVSAAGPASGTPTATVPPVLLACAQATNPVAGFTCNFPADPPAIIPAGPPYNINCTDNSSVGFNQSIASWKWDFGDGGTGTDKNPLHAYSEASLYDIRLTVTTWCGSQYSNITTHRISIFCSVPEPAFTTNVTEGYAPLAVQVTDSAKNAPEGITRWTYWFDDTRFSHSRNPVYTYTVPGTYTINQSVWKDCVPISSRSYPPATRQIIVKAVPSVSYEVNGTTTELESAQTLVSATPMTSEPPPAATRPEEPGSTPVSGITKDPVQYIPAVTGPTGIAILPVIALTLIILATIGFGIYLFRTHRKE
jgi:hypothetical protein